MWLVTGSGGGQGDGVWVVRPISPSAAVFQAAAGIGHWSVEFRFTLSGNLFRLFGNKLHPHHSRKRVMAFLREIFSLNLLHFVNHIFHSKAESAWVVLPGKYAEEHRARAV